jgi:hypothetical protein
MMESRMDFSGRRVECAALAHTRMERLVMTRRRGGEPYQAGSGDDADGGQAVSEPRAQVLAGAARTVARTIST